MTRVDSPSANVLVIIPTYNERDSIGPLIREILAHGYRVLVVDDNSPDGTGEIVERLSAEFPGRIRVIHRQGPRGLGRALIEGLREALADGADVICEMDADLSHDPKYLPAMIAAAGQYDLVIGSRYVQGVSVVNWPLRRLILSALGNQYIRLITRLNVRDCTGGYRCWRRDAVARIPLGTIRSDGYAFMVEMLYEAARSGCRIGEVPIIFVERRLGESKLSSGVLWESLVMPWRLITRRSSRKSA